VQAVPNRVRRPSFLGRCLHALKHDASNLVREPSRDDLPVT
jgi:hypothetical protein